MNKILKRIYIIIPLIVLLLSASCHKTNITYSVLYQLDGGAFNEDVSTTFSENNIPTLPTPIKDGYKFVGWIYKGEQISSLNEVLSADNQNVTLYASWEKLSSSTLNAYINQDYIHLGEEDILYVDGHFDDSNLILEYDENIISIDKYLTILSKAVGKTTIVVYSKDDPTNKTSIQFEVISKLPIAYFVSNRVNVGSKVYFDIRNLGELNETSLNEFEFTLDSSSSGSGVINDDFSITASKEGSIKLVIKSKLDARITTSVVLDVVNEDEKVVLKTENDKYVFPQGQIFSIDILGLQQNKEFIWGTGDKEVLRVMENGDIIAVGVGSTAISVYEKGNPSNRTYHEFIVTENNGDVDYIGNLLTIAFSQNGYKEGPNNDNKYGAWYGNPNQYWCAHFVSWCWYQAGLSNDILVKYESCSAGQAWCTEKGIFHARGTYTPKPGDIVFFNGHTGICAYVEGDYMYTIEGNASDRVGVWRWSLSHTRINGYASPEYPTYNGKVKDFSFLAGKDENGNYYWTNATGNQSTT